MQSMKLGAVMVAATSVATATTAFSKDGAAICAVEQAIACSPFEACERSLPGAINLPSLLKIDMEAGAILSVNASGAERSSPIAASTETEAAMTLQGVDNDHPWSLRVGLEDGRFALASVHEGASFSAFGVCSWGIL
jgi:hypothetical protein